MAIVKPVIVANPWQPPGTCGKIFKKYKKYINHGPRRPWREGSAAVGWPEVVGAAGVLGELL